MLKASVVGIFKSHIMVKAGQILSIHTAETV